MCLNSSATLQLRLMPSSSYSDGKQSRIVNCIRRLTYYFFKCNAVSNVLKGFVDEIVKV
eukprot:m.53723 g.53723  ORF g.53723 m.53723 type:complete len:59 (-) comp11057_c0_seq1:2633-2809(-)